MNFLMQMTRLLIADIGHWESEQFTVDLLFDILQAKFPTFAVLKSEVGQTRYIIFRESHVKYGTDVK